MRHREGSGIVVSLAYLPRSTVSEEDGAAAANNGSTHGSRCSQRCHPVFCPLAVVRLATGRETEYCIYMTVLGVSQGKKE